MRLGIGLGLFKAGLISAGVRIFSAFQTRVIGDGGTVESGTCVVNGINSSALLQQASFLLIPSGYKGGKLYSEIPTNGNGDLTWTRGGDAFRTNASGLLQRVPWNLLQQSNAFTTSPWSLVGTPTLTANYATNPLTGANDAWRFQSASSGNRVIQVISNSLTTFSLYAKGTGTIQLRDSTGNYTVDVALTSSWQRVTLYIPAAFLNVQITSNGGCDATIYGAQVVEGTTAQTYLPTTDRLNFPRLSYMYGSCPSVLLEPQRTNLLLYSQDLPSVIDKGTVVTVTSNSITAPDGTLTADTLTANGTGTLFVRQNCLTGTTQPCSNSVFVKKANHRYVGFRNNGSNSLHDVFDFDTKTWTNNSGSTLSYDELPNGWFRLKSTNNLGVANYYWSVLPALNTSGVETATVSNLSVYVWGGQAEQNANYVSTYIPTTSATATRIADSFSRSNIYTNGLISASGGTWFVESRNNVAYTRDAFGALWIGDNSSSFITGNSLSIRNQSSTSARLSIVKTIASSATTVFLTTTDTVKIAIKWNGTSADVFVNGVKEVSATSFTTTNMEFLAQNSIVPMFIQQMALFPTPLTDAQCQTLTTL